MFDNGGGGDGGMTSGPSWREADQQLRRLARRQGALDREIGRWLLIAERTRVHRELGHGSFVEYVERVLGWGPRSTDDRLRVARELERLPATAAALDRGEVSYSVVRDLTRVAEPPTERAWLARVAGKTAREVREMVAGHARGSLPTDPPDPQLVPRELLLRLEPHVYAMFLEARRCVEARVGERVSESRLIAAMCEAVLDNGDDAESASGGAPYQVAVSLCSECSRVQQHGGGQVIDVADAVLEQACCDGDWYDRVDGVEPVRARKTISRAMRRQLTLRDHGRCSVPGCRARRYLHVHHIEYRCRGGGNELTNLTLVCSAHHAAIHDGTLIVTGAAPHRLAFARPDGRPYGIEPPCPVEPSDGHEARIERDADREGRDDARHADARIADARIDDARHPDARIADARIADARTDDARHADARITDARIADARIADARIADARITDARSAMRNLGFPTRIAEDAIAKAIAHVCSDAAVPDLVREALRHCRPR